jgi:hypothetical protein
MVARKYVADTLNAANRTTGKPARAYTQGDVIAVGLTTAFEGACMCMCAFVMICCMHLGIPGLVACA